MTSRLTVRTLVTATLMLVVVAGVMIALLFAISRQHDASERARHSQAVIAAANDTEKQLLSVQTNIRGYLIRGNADLLTTYRAAASAFPDAAVNLSEMVADNPVQHRRAEAIRQQAASYVNDYGDPVIAAVRSGGVGAGRAYAQAHDGSARATQLDTELGKLVGAERILSTQRADAADAASRRALWIAVLGLASCMLLLALVTWYVARRIVLPIGTLSRAASRISRGEHDVRVPARRSDEVGRLGEAFNAMAHSLEESRTELESQNAELEMQTIELEERQVELTDVNGEVRAQRDELERTAADLAEAKQRAELYSDFADSLASLNDPEELADLVLGTLARAAGADVGVLYGESSQEEERWSRISVLGLDPAALADHAPAGGEGVSARAVASRRVIEVGFEESGLRVHTLAGEQTMRWELHVPLRSGQRTIGVATVGGVAGSPAGTEVLPRLAAQAAVALAEAGALARGRWLSQVNRVVLDCVREGIALIGLDHELVLSNTAIEGLAARLNMPVAAATGARGADLAHASSDPDAYFAEWEAILAGGDEPVADELAVAGLVLERYTAPVDDPSGARIGRLVVLRDVTREREAERIKNDLMATVSHELRTPLASVLGYAELLRTRRLDDSTRDEILGTVHKEAKRLSALIDDFLDLQTIEQDRLVLAREPFSVDDLLVEQVRALAGQSQEHQLEFVPGETPSIALGDRARIAQVIANLLSNAIKYSPGGGLVRVETERVSGEVVVAVSDEGVGIPPAEQSHVFEKFFRVQHPELRIGGTGLGLALAHEIVVAHGGRMGFESVENQGSRFWFALPMP